MKTDRDFFFDNAKFFLIIIVVLGHSMELVSGPYLASVYQLIYVFHMPAFIFISGYFSKKENPFKLAELIIYYIVFQTIYLKFDNIILNRDTAFTLVKPYWIMWFLLALIIWKLLTLALSKVRHITILSFALAILAGYDNHIGYYLSLSRIIVFYPFYLMGYFYQKPKSKFHITPALALLGFAGSYGILLHIHLSSRFLYHANSYEALKMNGIGAGAQRLFVLLWGILLTACFFSLIPKKETRYSSLGKRTLQAYLLHGFIIKLLAHYPIAQYITTPLRKAAFFSGMIILTILLLQKPLSYIFYPLSFITKYMVPAPTVPNTDASLNRTGKD